MNMGTFRLAEAEEEQMAREVRKGNCHYCGYLCGFDVTVEDGRIVDVKPDPTRYPYSPTVAARCRRWRMNLDDLDAPDRLNFPMKRVGARGSGRFERVSWDEALDDIAARLRALREEFGGRTLASAIGGPHATYWPLHRFMSQFGSPNNMGIGQICWNPRIWMDAVTFGWPTESELGDNTRAMMLWATNPAESDNSLFWTQIRAKHNAGVPLVVVDCRKSKTALAADVHLMPWPGTDAVLALSLIHVVLQEGLFDRDFVERWCTGFEGLRAHVAPYTPDEAQRVTGVPADDIRRAARIYATNGPALLLSGRGIDQLGPNTEPTVRALCLLRAITGNVDRPGSCYVNERSGFRQEAHMERPDLFARDERAFQLNPTRLQSYAGYDLVNGQTERFGRTLPERYLTSAHPGLVMRAMRDGTPYPVRALLVMGANPVLTYANTQLVLDALASLDLCVVADYRMTPTAQLADYALPVAAAFERPTCQIHGGVADYAYGGAAAIRPLHERRTDYEILRGLALRLGMGAEWPAATLEDEYDVLFEPAGLTFQQFAEQGIYAPQPTYRKHEAPGADGAPVGFATPSGKVELASSLLEQLGGSRYPQPVLEAVAHADLAHGMVALVTGARFQPYWASSYFQNAEFRAWRPFPRVHMASATAQALGLAEGDWARISNERGAAVLKVAYEDMPLGVASAEYGWWLPETPAGAPGYSGALVSNVNLLTDNELSACEPLIGTWTYNGLEVFVEKVACPGEFAAVEENEESK
ncbi:MAG: dehydrogenase [Coriobacteriaceae bacterium]|nr:dehydrogenase [Coriobacteriaceae bacterium]